MRRELGVGVLGLLAVATGAYAQADRDGSIMVRGVPMRPVEAGLADVGPLSTSQRLMRMDLRAPTSFEQVYRVEGPAGPFSSLRPSYFVRMDAGVTAVFPTSIYVPSGRGLEAVIPPGTVFSIGGPIEMLFGYKRGQVTMAESAPITQVAMMRAADRVATRRAGDPTDANLARTMDAGPRPASAPVAGEPEKRAEQMPAPQTIWTSELYRQRRVGELLRMAAAGERDGAGDRGAGGGAR